ncbi:hypothetical protein HAX54_002167, partial [Datura stramonium]|nr:hypothetical protein [Datura stramonium]
ATETRNREIGSAGDLTGTKQQDREGKGGNTVLERRREGRSGGFLSIVFGELVVRRDEEERKKSGCAAAVDLSSGHWSRWRDEAAVIGTERGNGSRVFFVVERRTAV